MTDFDTTSFPPLGVPAGREAALDTWTSLAEKVCPVDPGLYVEYDVKRGLRDQTGKGVLAGLTSIGDVVGTAVEGDQLVPAPGQLLYRGIEVTQLVNGFVAGGQHGFEETAYLLLFGSLPNKSQLDDFDQYLTGMRRMPRSFVHDGILRMPSRDIMNAMMRGVLGLYTLDPEGSNTSTRNVLRQSLHLVAKLPMLAVYAYQAYLDEFHKKSLVIHHPEPECSTAENFLHMLRPDSSFTKLESMVLDMMLVLHAEHGGGNNSAFATHVVSSSGTDTYSCIVTAIGSLKGPKHGGANNRVKAMIDDIKQNCPNWTNQDLLKEYLIKILKKEAFNGEGLIYGMGHAVYTLSDPRAVLLKEKALELAIEKNAVDEFNLYRNIETLTIQIFKEMKGPDFIISANLDLYSGFVYEMLNLPVDLFTPLFAAARIAGWCAHRIEQIVSDNKIMRPAYLSVSPKSNYIPLSQR